MSRPVPAQSLRCHRLGLSWSICCEVLGPLCRALCLSLLQFFPLALPVIHSLFHSAPWHGRCKVFVLLWFLLQGLLWNNLLARGRSPCHFSLYILPVYSQFTNQEYDCKLLNWSSECELLSRSECLSWRMLIHSACPRGHPGKSSRQWTRGDFSRRSSSHQLKSNKNALFTLTFCYLYF